MRCEAQYLLPLVRSLGELPVRALVICVVNQRTQDQPEVDASNRQTIHYLKSLGQITWQSPASQIPLTLVVGKGCDFLIVDRQEVPLPNSQGVGMARKIGGDIALSMQRSFQCFTQHRLYNTDGDVEVPLDYLNEPDNPTTVIKNFQHHGEAEDAAWVALQQYDSFLAYYVKGLAYAGSNYAFFTIGSTITCSLDHYAAVRGWPKRQAGEDFYFLNKLGKVGPVTTSSLSPISIRCRTSDRVPFGTGKAVSEIMGLKSPYNVYHPRCFSLLKAFLRSIDQYVVEGSAFELAAENHSLLEELGWRKNLESLRHSTLDKEQKMRRLNEWFDAFKTLKFIHAVRDHYVPDIPLSVALQTAEFLQPRPHFQELH